MAAANTDKFKKAKRRFSTTIGVGGFTAGATTLPLTSTSGLDTDTAITLVIEPGGINEEVITGVVSGSNIINCVRGKEGTTDATHTAGAAVSMYFTETHWDDAMTGILVSHNQDGTHATDSIITSNITNLAVTTAKIADTAITSAKITANAVTKATTIFNEVAATTWSNSTTTFSDITNWTGGSITTSGGDVVFHIEFTYYRTTAGNTSDFRIVIGSTNYPSNAGWRQYTNELSSHKMNARTVLVSGLSAGTYTVKMQAANVSGGSVNTDAEDRLRVTAVEYIR